MEFFNADAKQVYNEFIDSTKPDETKDGRFVGLFNLFTKNFRNLTEEEQKLLVDMEKKFSSSGDAPGKFFRERYGDVIEYCLGGEDEAEILYKYFDKLNKFPYTTGEWRRVVRTGEYVNAVKKIIVLINSAYRFRAYRCSLSEYMTKNFSEKSRILYTNSVMGVSMLADLIAAHIDAGDSLLKDTLTEIINGENNTAFLTTYMICGIIRSSDKDLHELLGKLLLAARLQEGLRQAICENADCGTHEAFMVIFDVIDKNDLLRYSSVRRAVATWIGILDPDNLTRSSDKTFRLMAEALGDRQKAYEMLDGTDTVKILTGLWALGVNDVDDAVEAMMRFAKEGNLQQKLVGAYYNKSIQLPSVQAKYSYALMESEDMDIYLAAGLIGTYMPDVYGKASLMRQDKDGKLVPERVKISEWFDDEKTARRHLDVLRRLLESMDKKKYKYEGYIFPWNTEEISRSDLLVRISAIACALKDDDLLDEMSARLKDADGSGRGRQSMARYVFFETATPLRRRSLINAIADRDSLTQSYAFRCAQKMEFSPEEYDLICSHLRLKSADVRLDVISLLKTQDEKGMIRSLNLLLKDKKEEARLGGLDILKYLIEEEKYEEAVNEGKRLINERPSLTDGEKIIVSELFGDDDSDDAGDALYSDDDIMIIPQITCDEKNYPLFDITDARLSYLFSKLDALIDEHKDEEIKTVHGETVIFGTRRYMPLLSFRGEPEDVVPLWEVWKGFFENEINGHSELLAMQKSMLGYGSFSSVREGVPDDYIGFSKETAKRIFGKDVVEFDGTKYKYGGTGEKNGMFFAYDGLIKAVVDKLVEVYCPKEYLIDVGTKVVEYLCCNVPDDKVAVEVSGVITSGEPYRASFIVSAIFQQTLMQMGDMAITKENFRDRFMVMYNLDQKFFMPLYNNYGWMSTFNKLVPNGLALILAAYYGMISMPQMYKAIFDNKRLRSNVQSIFYIYSAEKRVWVKRELERYGIDNDEEMKKFIVDVADKVASEIVSVECKRSDSPTEYSKAVTAIEYFCGAKYLVDLIKSLGNDKLSRSVYGYSSGSSRKDALSHLISVCHPAEDDSAEKLGELLKGSSISTVRLIEVAMYAPQWIDIIEEYLGFDGMKSGAYYFMAHMNDQYSTDERKYATIARFTPLDKTELQNGAFDIQWFEDAYSVLGEERFSMLYDAAKYICDGSKHSRARKYADAVLGKVSISDLEKEISEKRNKDLLMSYPLVPLRDKEDMLRRYEFIQKFRKESTAFGAQRRASESLASDMALRNLATRAGFKDVTRLTLVMESALTESLSGYFEWHILDDGKDVVEAAIDFSSGRPDVAVRKNGKIMASVPSAYKKHSYITELKDAVKKFREQYSRSVRMFELSMEEREIYTVEEITSLYNNPIVRPVVENLVFINDETGVLGIVYPGECASLVDVNGEVIEMPMQSPVRVAHPYDMFRSGCLAGWQKVFFTKQKDRGTRQPFRQVFRELYVKLDEELDMTYSRMFAAHQIQPTKAAALLKNRRWVIDHETGPEKVFYKDNIAVNMYALADWFSPSDIEAPTLEYVCFSDRKSYKEIPLRDVPDIVYSEAMRDVDLIVSVAHAGGVDPEASHSTVEMRRVIVENNIDLFGLENVTVKGSHAFIKGHHGEYTVHLGSGVVHMSGVHQLNVLPVHSQHRGKIFLPFVDDDPKTAEIVSKIILFAEDKKIKDPYILQQMK